MAEKSEVDSIPKISHKVAEYIWDYIYRNLLTAILDQREIFKSRFDD